MTELKVDDLQTVVGIIDVCLKRGAFTGEEISVIADIRGRFSSAVKAAKEASEGAKAGSDAGPVAQSEAEV